MAKEIIVGTAELAEILGYNNKNYISELVTDFDLPKVAFNKYNLYDVIPWHLEYKRRQHEAELQKVKNEKPQDDLARKNAIIKQLEIDERRGQLIDADLIKTAWLNEVTIFISALDTILADSRIQIKDEETTAILKSIITKQREKIAALNLNLNQETEPEE